MIGGGPAGTAISHQENFHRRWPQLRDPHLRALAWLLDAPDLLAVDAPCWGGRVATLGAPDPEVVAWLDGMQQPWALSRLHEQLRRQPTARLGRYAEQLLGFYLDWRRQLVAANLQVRDDLPPRATIGEFDFLVRRPDVDAHAGLEHWEFATKFYLLQHDPARDPVDDAFVGPNLADTLGRKMRKIMTQQLMLSQHRAAAAVLPEPVVSAQALVRGWLFYAQDLALPPSMGIADDHCRGFWADAGGWQERYLSQQDGLRFVLLRRLEWLAPARLPMTRSISLAALQEALAGIVEPVLIAVCSEQEGEAIELERGFAVPADWQQRAAGQAGQVRQALHQV